MLRTLIIMAFVALNLNALLAEWVEGVDFFSENQVKQDWKTYSDSNPNFMNEGIHPAYLLAREYCTGNSETLQRLVDLQRQAYNTAWKIFTEGWGFGGLNTAKGARKANAQEAYVVFWGVRKIIQNKELKTYSIPQNNTDSAVQTHLSLIGQLLDVIKKIRNNRTYREIVGIPEDAKKTITTWKELMKREDSSTLANKLQKDDTIYEMIFESAKPDIYERINQITTVTQQDGQIVEKKGLTLEDIEELAGIYKLFRFFSGDQGITKQKYDIDINLALGLVRKAFNPQTYSGVDASQHKEIRTDIQVELKQIEDSIGGLKENSRLLENLYFF